MKSFFRKKIAFGLAVTALSGTMVASAILPNWQIPERGSASTNELPAVADVTGSVETHLEDFLDTSVAQKLPEAVKPDEQISVILNLGSDTILDAYDRLNTSMTVGEYASSKEGKAVAARIERENNSLKSRIRNSGVWFEEGNTYNTLFSGFEILIKASAFDSLCKSVKGKASVIVGEVYAECETQIVENEVNVYGTGIFNSSDSKYDGSGTVIAVLDTGLDYTHSAFDESRFTPSKDDVITRENLAGKVSELRAAQFTPDLTAAKLYYSRKVPYTYDYADKDADVFPINSEHGTHVAGIMVGLDAPEKISQTDANGDPMGIRGVAPNAQLAVMKVFSEKDAGAKTSWILAALEDCVTLGVDVINMSLGSSAGFAREEIDDLETQQIYDRIKERGISLIAAASNDYNSSFNSEKNGNLALTDNPDSATVGAPSTYDAALSVACINGEKTPYMLYNNEIIYFTEASNRASEPKDFVDDILADNEESKEFDYITIPGIGQEVDYLSFGEGELDGKIALVKRGQTNFEEKARLAQKYGAVGCIIYNNVSGNINMTVGNIPGYPVCSVSRDDGEKLVSAPNGQGKITISRKQTAGPFMSDFSSWGPTPSLGIKPEITAHGGEIYSAVPGQRYDRLSGTSMASPNQAGVTALVRQYVKEIFPNYNAVQVTAAVNQLMMSTADIAYNTNGLPFSVRKQGAGLANLKKATETGAYLRAYDRSGTLIDKAKLEVGDDPEKKGFYEMKFEIYNFGSSALTYDLGACVMTEGISEQLTAKEGKRTVTETGYELKGAKFSVTSVTDGTQKGETVTVEAGKTAVVTVSIELTSENKAYLDENFANGMYVEGFLTLEGKDGAVSLSLPYLAFYGNWAQAPLFDKDYFETYRDELDENLPVEQKNLPDVFATRPVGGLYDDYITYLGAFAYMQDPASTSIVPAERDHIALSNQTGETGGVNSIYAIYLGMLRGAKRIEVTITDSVTGEVIWQRTEYNQRKSVHGGSPSWLEVEFNVPDYNLKNNTKYLVKVEGFLDYTDDGSESNLNNTFEFPFYTDFEAPIITGVDYSYEYDTEAKKNRLYADVNVYDNHYVQGYIPGFITENAPGSTYTYSLESFGRYITPVTGARNSTNTIRIELTDYLDRIQKSAYNGRGFLMQVIDYAGNTATYELAIPDDVHNISFPQEAEGGISISPNEVLPLAPDVFPKEDKAWAESLRYTSSDESVVRVVSGKLIGVSSGTATITATSNTDENLKATLTVKVLSETDPGYKPYTKPVAESFRLTGYYVNKVFYFPSSSERDLGVDEAYSESGEKRFVEFTGSNYTLKMYPSESITLAYDLKNYFDEDDYTVEFSSANSKIASVTSDGTITALNQDASGNPYLYERSTNISVRVRMKNASGTLENTLYSQTITITVKEPYTTNGPYLMSYMGLGDKVEIPEEFGVTEIYQYAFSNYRYVLKDLSAGDVIDDEDPFKSKPMYIGDNTITEVVIPEGVEAIDNYAFANLRALTKVSFPSTLRKIQTGAFYNCINLHTVEFRGDNNLQFINQDAFTNCTYLTDFDFHSAIAIGDRAFMNTGLMQIELPATAQSIGAQAFASCRNLDRVTINAARVKFGEGAFSNCAYLYEMVFNTPVIPASVCEGCSALKEVTIGADVTVIDQYAFRGTQVSNLKVLDGNTAFETQSGGNYLLERGTSKLALVAPSTAIFRPDNSAAITAVATGAFSACTNLTSVTLSSVTEVDDYAFAKCSSLRTITLGELTKIGKYAFYGTPITQQPTLAKNVTIGEGAFAGYRVYTDSGFSVYSPRFTAFTAPDGATIGDRAFNDNFVVSTARIGDDVTIGTEAFYGAISLSNVTIGDNAVIGAAAFSGLATDDFIGGYFESGKTTAAGYSLLVQPYFSAISRLTIGDNAVIGARAFYGAGSFSFRSGATAYGGTLTSVTLGSNATIGDYAFYLCRNLTSINLANAASIGAYAFSGELPGWFMVRYASGEIEYRDAGTVLWAPAITAADLGSATSVGAGAFANAQQLASVTMNDVAAVGSYTFARTALTSFDFAGIDSIGDYAFTETKLSNITLKSGVTIGDGAFENCSALSSVTGLGTAAEIGASAFAYTGLTAADLSSATYLGDFAFAFTDVSEVTLGNSLRYIGENPFVDCAIDEFENANGETTYDIGSDGIQVIDGVLYRPRTSGLELVTYPQNKADKAFTVAEDAVRISAFACYGAQMSMVEFGYKLGAIGDMAFYGCNNLAVVVFGSINAPILEETYDPTIEEENEEGISHYRTRANGYYHLQYTNGTSLIVGLGISPYRAWNADPANVLYGATFAAAIGTEEGRATHANKFITMVRPDNGVGYENFTYEQYFDVSVVGKTAPAEETVAIIRLINALPATITLADKEAVVAIRARYDALGIQQKALVTNISVLENAEAAIKYYEEENNNDNPPDHGGTTEIDPVVLGVSIGAAVLVAVALVAVAIVLLVRKGKKEKRADAKTSEEKQPQQAPEEAQSEATKQDEEKKSDR